MPGYVWGTHTKSIKAESVHKIEYAWVNKVIVHYSFHETSSCLYFVSVTWITGDTQWREQSLSSKGLCSRAGHQSSAHEPSPACHLFRQIKFIITQPHSFVSALSTVAFVLQRQNSVFATETVWLASLKHSLSSPLHTKVCWLLRLSIHL